MTIRIQCPLNNRFSFLVGVGERMHNFTFAKLFPMMLRAILRSGYAVRSFDSPGAIIPGLVSIGVCCVIFCSLFSKGLSRKSVFLFLL
jgi:hypothetical protein